MKKVIGYTVTIIVCIVVACLFATGCTEGQRAKKFGGNMNVTLPHCQKLVAPTWKDSNLWYAYRPMRAGEKPETTIFKEDSNFGVLNGTVTFIESCN